MLRVTVVAPLPAAIVGGEKVAVNPLEAGGRKGYGRSVVPAAGLTLSV